MSKIKFSLAALLLLSLISLRATADSRPHSLYFNLGLGEVVWDELRKIQNTGVGFVGLGYNFTKHWGMEGNVGFFSSRFEPAANNQKQISGNLYLVDALYHFNPYKHFLEPYLAFGIGVTVINPNYPDANNEGNINGAAGFNLFFDKAVALRFELKDMYTLVGGKNDVYPNAALSFYFDL